MPTVPGIYHRSFTLHHLASAARGGACSLLRKEAASVRYQPAAKNAPTSVHHKSPLPHVGAGFIPPDPDFLERLLKSQSAYGAEYGTESPRPWSWCRCRSTSIGRRMRRPYRNRTTGGSRTASHYLNMQSFSKSLSGSTEGLQGHREVVGIQQAVNGCTAGTHSIGKGAFGQMFLLHGLLKLKGNHPFGRSDFH